ncbi:MAG: hypothetical protein OXB88_06425 [Bacteriovoracales bacterium]|nr:hypothetical protein [Bacteriovoracales bacterium]
MIRFLICFSISFFILSIPIKNRPLFDHLSQQTNPYTHIAFEKISSFVKEKFGEKKILGMKVMGTMAHNLEERKSTALSGGDMPGEASESPSKSKTLKRSTLNKKSEVLGEEHYSEKELYQLKMMLKNSDI